MAEVDSSVADDSSFLHPEAQDDPSAGNLTANATVGARRQANGSIGSVYSGNKIKHLKKEDGIPLWRKDIQYQFLKLVFEDPTPVFTRYSDSEPNMQFADVYIDAMARSSKTSRILKEKLQNDRPAAISMAMVCLLVNFGRMNTTLNFFPEMRAQLRTYHSIPSLQAHQDPNAYKQLQDAPRLKSILKGASEDIDQPNTMEKIKYHAVPRTNPVNLIFVLAQFAPKVSEMHFFPPRDFFDLVMRSSLSSKSRAKAFLWLMWWYLESDFSKESALNNPFGPGLEGEGTGGLPVKVPTFESLTEEQANEENVDSPSELEYGESKRLERKRILEEDEPLPRLPKRSKKGFPDYGYDDDQGSDIFGRGSAMSTPLHPSAKRHPLDDEDEYYTPGQSARSRNKRPKRDSSLNRSSGHQRLVLKTKSEQSPDAVSPAPPGSGPMMSRFVTEPSLAQQSSRRPRPLTQHQLAVEQYRRQRIDYLLAKRKSNAYRLFRTKRENEIPFSRCGRLLQSVPDGYDTEDEENSWGMGGVLPNPDEEEDFGECANYFLSVVRKATRRLDRWDHENANGPKRDRRKEREERQRARMDVFALDEPVDVGGGRAPTSARNRSRASRNAKRRGDGAGRKVGAATAHAPGRHPLREGVSVSTQAEGPSKDGDDDLDDIDRELLGEASGDDDDDHHVPRPSGPGYEDSYIGEALSSDDTDEEPDEGGDVEMHPAGEGYDNSSTYEGGESSSMAGGDPDAEAGGKGIGEQRPGAVGGEVGVTGPQ